LRSGLDVALRELADRASVSVTLDVPAGRWPALVESTAYFVAAEALANVERHASATHVSLRVGEISGSLRLEIVDDGVGGAAPSSGSGLDGLVHRVEASGGRLRIDSPSGSGTRLTVELPLDRATEPRDAIASTRP
jgi:signal transduction histidine kinase